MGLVSIATEILIISEDLRRRFNYDKEYDDGELYDFDQTWGSTALGFSGMGGQMMTTARTYVFIPNNLNYAYVYFGARYAYRAEINEAFKEDLRNHRMASVMQSGRYINR